MTEYKKDQCCDMWKKGINYLNGFIALGHMHGEEFDIIYQFKYCPYCGDKRIIE